MLSSYTAKRGTRDDVLSSANRGTRGGALSLYAARRGSKVVIRVVLHSRRGVWRWRLSSNVAVGGSEVEMPVVLCGGMGVQRWLLVYRPTQQGRGPRWRCVSSYMAIGGSGGDGCRPTQQGWGLEVVSSSYAAKQETGDQRLCVIILCCKLRDQGWCIVVLHSRGIVLQLPTLRGGEGGSVITHAKECRIALAN
ncbi:hypothetical protein BDQ17DRAFT_1329621 [Cyathus striatus]|nr:hypothetical protein BDQ17DRAFT_1329621 [Cyathus striatus]